MAEVDKILEWLDNLVECHAAHMADKRLTLEAMHHRNACKLVADGIRRGEHMTDYRNG